MQNKANSPNDKTTTTSYATQIYSNIPLYPTPKKQTQTKPILQRNTRYATRNTKTKPKRTQFQNGQNEDKYSNDKGLCQRTTNNEQRTLSKTNPIKPNSPVHPESLGVRW
jgi:hypothetical protein